MVDDRCRGRASKKLAPIRKGSGGRVRAVRRYSKQFETTSSRVAVMALPLPPGLTPPEVAFLCEMELVTVIPRQRLEALELLGVRQPLQDPSNPTARTRGVYAYILTLTITKGPLKPLNPPQRSNIPLWLALLLKRQRRANILAPPWLNTHSLTAILDHETEHADTFSPPPRLPPQPSDNTLPISPPFLPNSTADAAPDALPYHWLELGEMLLEAASDDFEEPDQVRKLLRGLREVRMAKLRSGVDVLDAAGGIKMNGVGGMEVGEGRSFITGVIDGLRYVCCTTRSHVVEMLIMAGKSELHANSNAKTATQRRQRTATQALQATTTMTKWICNERAHRQTTTAQFAARRQQQLLVIPM